jgi:DnaJ-class molecular chaperone
MHYFSGCKNIEEVKDRYKKWSKILHPDLGGNADHFKDMQDQYDNLVSGKKKKQDKPKKHNKVEDTVQSPQFFDLANNLITLVRQGVELARDINSLMDDQDKQKEK